MLFRGEVRLKSVKGRPGGLELSLGARNREKSTLKIRKTRAILDCIHNPVKSLLEKEGDNNIYPLLNYPSLVLEIHMTHGLTHRGHKVMINYLPKQWDGILIMCRKTR